MRANAEAAEPDAKRFEVRRLLRPCLGFRAGDRGDAAGKRLVGDRRESRRNGERKKRERSASRQRHAGASLSALNVHASIARDRKRTQWADVVSRGVSLA